MLKCACFLEGQEKNKGYCEVFTLKVKEEEKNMSFPKFGVALKKKKINKYRFVLGSVGERNKKMMLMRKK